MQSIIIEVGGESLDVFQDFGISLNYQIEEVFDIAKRKTNYSKTIELPGSTNNNKFFENIFDVNVTTLSYNPSIMASDVNIRVGDNLVFSGNMQLANVKNTQGEITYEVVVFGVLKTILTELADLELNQLDLSKYNHTRDMSTVAASWYYSVRENGVLTSHASGGHGYVYPHIMNDFKQSNQANTLLLSKQYPATYCKTILDSIFELGNYTYTSTFFNSDYFKKLIMPFTDNKITLDQDVINERTSTVGVDGNDVEYVGGIPTGYRSLTYSNFKAGEIGWYYNSNHNWYLPLFREYGEVGDKEYMDDLNQWTGHNGWVCQNAGWYDFSMNLKLFAKYHSENGGKFQYKGTNTWKFFFRVYKRKANGQQVLLYDNLQPSGGPQEIAPSDNNWHENPWYDLDSPINMAYSQDEIYMEVGDRILIQANVNYVLDSSSWNTQGSGSKQVRMRPVIKESFGGEPSYITMKPSSDESHGNEFIDLASTLPKMKITEWFLNIVKMFDLVVVDNPNKPRDLIIEPRRDYFLSKPRIVDWSDKLDRDSEIKLSPMAEIDTSKYLYKYMSDSDFYNEQHEDAEKEVYGSKIIEIDNDFSTKDNKIELIFAATPNADEYISPRVAPYFAEMASIGEFKSKKVKPRILFYGGPLEINHFNDPSMSYEDRTVVIKEYLAQPNNEGITASVYPYAGMWDHPYEPMYSLDFQTAPIVYWNNHGASPLNDLYNMYHRYTLENIIDINAKILEATFELDAIDIAQFDFRDSIFIDGQYWRIMKIKDYDPTGGKLTKVQLYKITNFDTYIELPDGGEFEEGGSTGGKCPTDIRIMHNYKDWYYKSISGQYISADCCKTYGGVWDNGACKVRKKPGGVIGVVKPVIGVVRPLKPNNPIGGTIIGSVSRKPAVLLDGLNNGNAGSGGIKGTGNVIGGLTENINITGNNNSVLPGVKNVTIVGDNITADVSDSIYIGDVRIDKDGSIHSTRLVIIDGGEDEVLSILKRNPVDIVDGTVDAVRNWDGDYSNRIIIDANDPSITPFE